MPHTQDRKQPLLLMHWYPQIIHPTAERFSPLRLFGSSLQVRERQVVRAFQTLKGKYPDDVNLGISE